MKIARRTRAISTPTSRTRCWYCDGHRELRHDQDEDEEVVDAQRLLGDEAREELPGGLAAAEEQQAEPEEPGQDDPDDRPDSGFLDRHVVRLAADEEVDRDQGGTGRQWSGPTGSGKHPLRLRQYVTANDQRRRCRRSLPPGPRPDRRHGPTPRDHGRSVLTGTPRGREYSPPCEEQYPNHQGKVKRLVKETPSPQVRGFTASWRRAAATWRQHLLRAPGCPAARAPARTSRRGRPRGRRGGRRAPG